MADATSSRETLAKHDAQQRADQIRAFREELTELGRDGVLVLDDAQSRRVDTYHAETLGRLTHEHDIDPTSSTRHMSRGMQLASLLGAAALTAAVVSFLNRVWGSLPMSGQVVLLTVSPVAATGVMVVAARLERTKYIAALVALVGCGAFVTQTVLLGELFGLPGGPHVVGAWAAFAAAVAWPWRFGLPFVMGVSSLVVYLAGLCFHVAGGHWTTAFERPEPLAAAAVAVGLALPRVVPRELRPWGRGTSLAWLLVSVLILTIGDASLLPFDARVARGGYQALAVVLSVVAIGGGLRASAPETVVLGTLFAFVFMLTRFVDWWWDWMPRYLFFLILAAVAVGWIWALRTMRTRLLRGAA